MRVARGLRVYGQADSVDIPAAKELIGIGYPGAW